MGDLHKLSATEARALLAKGKISAEELVRGCLAHPHKGARGLAESVVRHLTGAGDSR